MIIGIIEKENIIIGKITLNNEKFHRIVKMITAKL